MKNYGHTWQWGKDSEYTIDICIHWSFWALPFVISWWKIIDAMNNKYFILDIDFLCFRFNIETWRWSK